MVNKKPQACKGQGQHKENELKNSLLFRDERYYGALQICQFIDIEKVIDISLINCALRSLSLF